MTLTTILRGTPVASVDGAIIAMRAIDAALPDADGVKWFNRLYLRVTERVGDAVHGTTFEEPDFLAVLDVAFANLYFAALRASLEGPQAAPSAWRPLLAQRHATGIARIQFALAGMSAHINRDLPEGIVRAFDVAGGDPTIAAPRRRDFDAVNDILERVEGEVKTEFAVGLVGLVDELGGAVDDAVAMWKVRKARSAAWTNAEVLWTLRAVPRLHDRFFRRLDGLVGLTAHGLLVPRLSDVRRTLPADAPP